MLCLCFVKAQELIAGTCLAVISDIMRSLKPADMNAADRSTCLPGTRQDCLKEVIDWLMTPSDQNMLWLYGAAGLGKSTIATTIADYFGGLHRRGAFLFFDRNFPLESAPKRVISTLAYQLAQQHRAICSAIFTAIDHRPQLVSDPLGTQIKSLLLEPLLKAAAQIEGPIIIILDALDECGDAASRRQLLDLLSQEFSGLPSQFRILITSRPEHDIKCAFSSRSHIHTIDVSKASDEDMRRYFRHEMGRIYEKRHEIDELPVHWPGEEAIRRLTLYATGLFIWAATAMKLLFAAHSPDQWLDDLLLHDRPVFTLGELYKTALLSASDWDSGETTKAYKRILGLIIISQIPLTDEAIVALLGFRDGGKTCRTALQRLGCVIQWSKGQPARTLHKSFPDYLTNRNYCSSEPWFIDVNEHHHALTIACLGIMNEQLHFNMCQLTTSHIPNERLLDVPGLIKRFISPSLSYSCLFWGHHLQETLPGESSILSLILDFYEGKFLYWLEVLSLMGEVRSMARTMIAAKEYAMVSRYCMSNDY